MRDYLIAATVAAFSISAFAADPPDAPKPPAQTEADWIDDRFSRMDTGPFLTATVLTPQRPTYKGIAIKLGDAGQAAVCFDTDLLRYSAGWTGGFLKINPARYGLIGHPEIGGSLEFSSKPLPGWSISDSFVDPRPAPFGPLPPDTARYEGLYIHGRRVVLACRVGDRRVLDSPWVTGDFDATIFSRTFDIGPGKAAIRAMLGDIPPSAVRLVGDGASLVEDAAAGVVLSVPASDQRLRVKVFVVTGEIGSKVFDKWVESNKDVEDLEPLTQGGPARWGKPLATVGSVDSSDAALAVDTITVPYDNPFKALMFLSGHDFLSTGAAAVSSVHGDVWLVRGIDDELANITWQRFATGLYQPLGVKVVHDKVYVQGRDQITRLHDLNGDGEADFYENFNNAGHVTENGHEYVAGLETDAAGNFYYLKCASNSRTPHDGSLLKVPADGSGIEVVANGFRNPVGLGIGPDGTITVADQQGEWVPSTRLDVVKPGGFYGYVPTAHREKPPTDYDPPLCWLPHAVDNSAGGQVWLSGEHWGPLDGRMLHLAWGRCNPLLVMREKVGETWQGGVAPLPVRFLAGPMRARQSPIDGHLYVTGLDGWQTAAVRDGCLQRVRYTGKPLNVPLEIAALADGLRITFSDELDRELAEDVESYAVERWNYRWSSAYGSRDWRVSDPKTEGHDAVAVESAALAADGRTVFLKIADLRAAMQMQVRYDLESSAGEAVRGAVYHTVHKTGR